MTDNINKAGADSTKEEARKELASKCDEVIKAAKGVMAFESDHIMQHAITVLIEECQWCSREMRDSNGK